MKKIIALACFLFCASIGFAQLDGAWKLSGNGTVEVTCIVADNYFMQTTYNKTDKLFVNTQGGTITAGNDGKMRVTIEFNTEDSTSVGQIHILDYKLDNNVLTIQINGSDKVWQRIDDGKGGLAGNWRITEREQNGKMNPMRPGPRKTLKLLSGTRFQWAAINTETREFFGTGGGTYTFSNGKYTENIEFFSRDNSRVGASLSFDGKVNGKKWHHSGKSSKGDRIAEIWTRQN